MTAQAIIWSRWDRARRRWTGSLGPAPAECIFLVRKRRKGRKGREGWMTRDGRAVASKVVHPINLAVCRADRDEYRGR
jgi:hypothetical protein